MGGPRRQRMNYIGRDIWVLGSDRVGKNKATDMLHRRILQPWVATALVTQKFNVIS